MKALNQRSKTEFTPYLATAIAEGFCEGENATLEQQIEAWAYLIKTGLAYKLQGWFGRAAQSLIAKGLVNSQGEIDWDQVDEAQNDY